MSGRIPSREARLRDGHGATLVLGGSFRVESLQQIPDRVWLWGDGSWSRLSCPGYEGCWSECQAEKTSRSAREYVETRAPKVLKELNAMQSIYGVDMCS